MPTTMQPSALQVLFDELNAGLFGGRLPAYAVAFVDLSERPWLGYCDRRKRTIALSDILRDADPEAVRLTLIHECAHIEPVPEGQDDHGPAFRRRLRDLIARDERLRGARYAPHRRRLLIR